MTETDRTLGSDLAMLLANIQQFKQGRGVKRRRSGNKRGRVAVRGIKGCPHKFRVTLHEQASTVLSFKILDGEISEGDDYSSFSTPTGEYSFECEDCGYKYVNFTPLHPAVPKCAREAYRILEES